MKRTTVKCMEHMDDFFRSRGIEVQRDYDRRAKRYYFRLTLDKMLGEFRDFCAEYGIGFMDTDGDRLIVKDYCFPWDPNAVKKVIFNDPATIVFWSDGSKTVVKCSENDIYDPEKGLAMAFAKKMFGNDNSFHKLFTKWLPKEEPKTYEIKINADTSDAISPLKNFQMKMYEAFGLSGKKL